LRRRPRGESDRPTANPRATEPVHTYLQISV